MNCPRTRTPNPIIRDADERVAIWMIEDIHLIYDEKHKIWYQRALDILADQDPRPASDTLVGDYLACFGLTIERLLKTLEK